MSTSRESGPIANPMLHIVLFLASIAAFALSLSQTAFTLSPAAAPTSQPATATAPSTIATSATIPADKQPESKPATTQPASAPASQLALPPEAVSGYTCLIYGWVTLKDYKLAWLANVAFAVTLVCALPRKLRKIADGASLLCVGFAVLFLLTEELHINGESRKIISYGWGFYFWIGGMIAMWLGFMMNPAWKEGFESEPAPAAPAPAKKKSTAVVKTKKKEPIEAKTETETSILTPDDWPFFYGKKSQD